MPSEPSQPAKSTSLSKCKAFNLEKFAIKWEVRAPFLDGEFERITECRNPQFRYFLDKGVDVKTTPHRVISPEERQIDQPTCVPIMLQICEVELERVSGTNVSNINQKTTSHTRSSSNPDLVLVGRGSLPTLQQSKLRRHMFREGTHHEQRKEMEPTCSHAYLQSMYLKERDISIGGRPITQPKF